MRTILNNSPALIPLILLGTAVIIPIIAIKKKSIAFPAALFASSFSVFLSIYNIIIVIQKGTIHYYFGGWAPPIGIEYVLDPLSAFFTLVINSIAFFVLIHSKKVVEKEHPEKKVPYYAVVMLMLCGFNGIVLTGDFFNLYVFLEISSLSLYGLIAIGEKKSPIAAFRYLIMGTVGAVFYLLGTGFLFVATGSLNMADIKNILPDISNESTVIVALSLMIIGMAIKMAIFPLHGWLPDSYTYAPSSTAALVAPTGTKIGAYVIIRILFFVFGVATVSQILPITRVLSWLAAIGIIYGSVMAIAQKEMKRMLAYSSVAQVGYIGLGIGLANPMGLIGAVLHVMNHALMKACLFLVAGNFRTKLGHSNIKKFSDSIRKQMPWTTAAFTVAALSMVGLPPTVGFFSKWYLALGTIKNSNWIFLAVILVSSLLNAVYFFRILEKIYLKPLASTNRDSTLNESITKIEAPFSMLIPTLVLAIAIIILGLLNAFIVKGIIEKIIPAGMM
ncbi:MAG: monovalent cation/H+ antiporter subunit D family protein [Candidatus Aminicenantes bacterium]|nr:monovalent cation/H+ antiporter subunit D family protein [Candidatus Aminicenantes bacterium]